MNRIALIDGDVMLYQCGFAAEHRTYTVELPDGTLLNADDGRHANKLVKANENSIRHCEHYVAPVEHAIQNLRTKLDFILRRTGAGRYKLYLTGDGNFRETLVDDYKANRTAPKPVHYEDMREFMLHHMGAELIEGQEADDAMAIEQMNSFDDTIICTIDKDLKMIPGNHYHLSDDRLFKVSELEGIRFFYTQILTGDSTDNIHGLFARTGRKVMAKTKEPIETLTDELSLWAYVCSVYDVELDDEELITTAQLLWMRREPDQLWRPPTEVTYYERKEGEEVTEDGSADQPASGDDIRPDAERDGSYDAVPAEGC